jgi:hypothetical protein
MSATILNNDVRDVARQERREIAREERCKATNDEIKKAAEYLQPLDRNLKPDLLKKAIQHIKKTWHLSESQMQKLFADPKIAPKFDSKLVDFFIKDVYSAAATTPATNDAVAAKREAEGSQGRDTQGENNPSSEAAKKLFGQIMSGLKHVSQQTRASNPSLTATKLEAQLSDADLASQPEAPETPGDPSGQELAGKPLATKKGQVASTVTPETETPDQPKPPETSRKLAENNNPAAKKSPGDPKEPQKAQQPPPGQVIAISGMGAKDVVLRERNLKLNKLESSKKKEREEPVAAGGRRGRFGNKEAAFGALREPLRG